MRVPALAIVVLLLNLAACVALPWPQPAVEAEWLTQPEDTLQEPGAVSPRRVH